MAAMVSVLGLGLPACGSRSAAAPDAGALYSCAAPPSDLAACQSVADCATVASGCYCGSQPVTGVAQRYADTAQACEATAASTCARGCAVDGNRQAQDGRTAGDGVTIAVQCASGLCRSYVP